MELKFLSIFLVVLQVLCASGATSSNQQPFVRAERVTTLQRKLIPPEQTQQYNYWWPEEATSRKFPQPEQYEENLVEQPEENYPVYKTVNKNYERNDIERGDDCKSVYYDEYTNEYFCEDEKKEKAARTTLGLLSLVPAILAPLLFIAGAALMFPFTITLPVTGTGTGTGEVIPPTDTGPSTISRMRRDVGMEDPAEEELNSIHRDFLAATEACWKRFACESQKAVRKNDFVNDLVKTAFGSYVENPEADHAREMPDDDCEVFECDVLSNLFS